MLSVGTQRTLARVSSASDTQTLACAAAMISGRASESRSAVARLIGNGRSVASRGAGPRFRFKAPPVDIAAADPSAPGGDAEGKPSATWLALRTRGATVDRTRG